uniref:small monomeric GTPase n=2 Tax=Tetranychus urticae TaxID=32264 RepID=T1KK86_TETUR
MELISSLRSLVHLPMLLLGNKRDLEQGREVSLSEGRNQAMSYESQFFEVSAADSYVGVSVSFDALIRELVSQRLRRSSRSPSSASSNNYKKLSIVTVSKVFGAVFGGKNNNSVYYSNIDLINSTQCSAHSPESGINRENKFKKCVPLLNSRSFCKSKKSTHTTMIKVTRKASPPILSL